MIGGMTYSETRAATELSNRYNVDIFLGTDGFFNPSSLWRKAPRMAQVGMNSKREKSMKMMSGGGGGLGGVPEPNHQEEDMQDGRRSGGRGHR